MTMQIRQLGLPTVQQLSGRLGLPTIQQLSGLGATPFDTLSTGEKLLDFGAVTAGLLSIGAAVAGHKELAHGAAWVGLFGGLAGIAMSAYKASQVHSTIATPAVADAQNSAAFTDTLFGGGALAASAIGFFLAGR